MKQITSDFIDELIRRDAAEKVVRDDGSTIVVRFKDGLHSSVAHSIEVDECSYELMRGFEEFVALQKDSKQWGKWLGYLRRVMEARSEKQGGVVSRLLDS